MQFLLLLLAILLAIFGITAKSLVGLLGGAICMVIYTLKSRQQSDVKKIAQTAHALFGQVWQVLTFFAVGCSGAAALITYHNPFDQTSPYLWLLALALIGVAALLHDRTMRRRSARLSRLANKLAFDRYDWLSMLALTVGAFALRAYRLSGFLPPLHGDEGEMGMLALLARYGPASGISPQPLPLFTTAFLDHPTLFHYVQAGAMLLFGETETGLRMLSAVFGALCIPLIYAIGRVGWGRIAGLMAGWLMLVSHLHLHYSRIALNNIQSAWFTILFMLVLMWIYEGAQTATTGDDQTYTGAGAQTTPSGTGYHPLLPMLVAGFALGIGQYFYYGSRLMPVIGLPLFLFLWWKKRINVTQIIFLLLTVLVACAPLIAHYSKNIPAFINRMRGVSIFHAEGMAHTLGATAVWPQDIPRLFWEQLIRNLNFFVQSGDASAFYLNGRPVFDPLTVLFFWLGLGVVFASIRRFHEFSLLIWFSVGLLLAGVLTNDAPNGPRLIIVVSVVFVVGGLFLQKIYQLLAQVWPQSRQYLAVILCSSVAATTFYLNFNAYFVEYVHLRPALMPISMAHEMDDEKQDYRAYLLGAPNFFVEYGTIRFIARAAETHNLDNVSQLSQIALDPINGKGLAFFILPHRASELPEIAARFPDGTQVDRFDPLNRLLYTVYRVPGLKTDKDSLSTPCPPEQSDCSSNPAGNSTTPANLSPLLITK